MRGSASAVPEDHVVDRIGASDRPEQVRLRELFVWRSPEHRATCVRWQCAAWGNGISSAGTGNLMKSPNGDKVRQVAVPKLP
jgi:hypothetical protein